MNIVRSQPNISTNVNKQKDIDKFKDKLTIYQSHLGKLIVSVNLSELSCTPKGGTRIF